MERSLTLYLTRSNVMVHYNPLFTYSSDVANDALFGQLTLPFKVAVWHVGCLLFSCVSAIPDAWRA